MTDDNKQNEFLYKMSTSMRSGLAHVNKYVNELYKIEELEGYLDEKDNPIENVKAAFAPLVSQLSDFQDYAETVTGRMELNLEEVDVHALLDGVMTIADQLIEQKDGSVVLEEEIEEDLPTIEADATRLSQALLNLIHNAFKFTDKGFITVRVALERENILFEVRDTGIGISAEDQELVFEPFETILADKRRDTRLIQQVGIGLAIGFAVRIVFASIELAGEVIGFQMGLNFAAFFDPSLNSQSSAVARFYGQMAALLFIVMNGHLLVLMVVIRSFERFPVDQSFLTALARMRLFDLGTDLIASGLWIALPMIGMLMFVNLALGIVSRVAPQMNIYAVGFPVTLSIGLIGITATLPALDQPFLALMERTMSVFGK